MNIFDRKLRKQVAVIFWMAQYQLITPFTEIFIYYNLHQVSEKYAWFFKHSKNVFHIFILVITFFFATKNCRYYLVNEKKRTFMFTWINRDLYVQRTTSQRYAKKQNALFSGSFFIVCFFNTFALVVFYDRLVKDGFKGDQGMEIWQSSLLLANYAYQNVKKEAKHFLVN